MFSSLNESGKRERMPIGCTIGILLGILIVPTVMLLGIVKIVELIKDII